MCHYSYAGTKLKNIRAEVEWKKGTFFMRIERIASLSEVEVGVEAEALRLRPPDGGGEVVAAPGEEVEEQHRTNWDLGKRKEGIKCRLLGFEAKWSSCFSLTGCSAASITAPFSCSLSFFSQIMC